MMLCHKLFKKNDKVEASDVRSHKKCEESRVVIL